MDPVTPTEFVEELIDLCASITAFKDYEYDVRDNIVVRARIEPASITLPLKAAGGLSLGG